MSHESTLITTLRRRLTIQVAQVERFFRDSPAPSYILLEIEDARREIATLKAQAQHRGETIADDPLDQA